MVVSLSGESLFLGPQVRLKSLVNYDNLPERKAHRVNIAMNWRFTIRNDWKPYSIFPYCVLMNKIRLPSRFSAETWRMAWIFKVAMFEKKVKTTSRPLSLASMLNFNFSNRFIYPFRFTSFHLSRTFDPSQPVIAIIWSVNCKNKGVSDEFWSTLLGTNISHLWILEHHLYLFPATFKGGGYVILYLEGFF